MANSIIIHNEKDFEAMRKAGHLAAEVLDYITDFIKPGVTTLYLNDLCHEFIIRNNAKPAALNYPGPKSPFPKSVCISVNHVICHGIPSDKKLNDGDILNIDSAVILDGYYGDSSRMYYAGNNIPIKAQKLTQITYECMMLAIEIVKPGIMLNQIGKIIQEHAEKNGFSVVRDFCGHGLGKVFHAYPSVLHYYDPTVKDVLQEGMFFTIEPMINAGSFHCKVLNDGWTAVTKDRLLSAQFEHTIGVTKDGYEIFTLSPKGLDFPKLNPYK